jgi:hypothetical protein
MKNVLLRESWAGAHAQGRSGCGGPCDNQHPGGTVMTYQSNISSLRLLSDGEAALVAGGLEGADSTDYFEDYIMGCYMTKDGGIIDWMWGMSSFAANYATSYNLPDGQAIVVWQDGHSTLYNNGCPVIDVHNVVVTGDTTTGISLGVSNNGPVVTVNFGNGSSVQYTLGKG